MARLRKIHGSYYAYFYNRYRSPKEKSYPLGVSDKKAAQVMVRDLERQMAEGVFDPWNPQVQPKAMTYSEAVEAFMVSRQDLRPKSRTAYLDVLNALGSMLPKGITIAQVRSEHLQPFIMSDTSTVREGREKPLSKATLRKRHRHVKAFFRWAHASKLIETNPLDDVRPPRRGEAVPQFLNVTEYERLLAAIDFDAQPRVRKGGRTPDVQWLRDLVVLAVNTGMRLGELGALRWSAVDFHDEFIYVRNTNGFETKSGHERAIPMVGDALDVLSRLNRDRKDELDGPVLVRADGTPIDVNYASKRFKHYVRLAKLPDYIHFHSLRHTCASWLVQNGVPLPVVQKVLGHSTYAMTQVYAHLAPDHLVKAMKDTFGKR